MRSFTFFLCGEFLDIKVDNSLMIPASWFTSNIRIGKTNKAEGKYTWFDNDSIHLAININIHHCLLSVILPKDRCIHHFVSLGNKPSDANENCLCIFLNNRNLIESFDSVGNVWKIDDLMCTKKFLFQQSADSCEAMAC